MQHGFVIEQWLMRNAFEIMCILAVVAGCLLAWRKDAYVMAFYTAPGALLTIFGVAALDSASRGYPWRVITPHVAGNFRAFGVALIAGVAIAFIFKIANRR